MSSISRSVDVLLVSDLRFPGGTSRSIATEVEAQHAAGYRTGLLHLNGPLVRKVRPVNPAITQVIRSGKADLLVGPEPVRARLVVFRHPAVLQTAADQLPPIEADQVIILANSGPRTPDGRPVYDVPATDRLAREKLGVPPLWAPIGPLVRDEIEHLVPDGRVMDRDWVNIIDVDSWAVDRPDWADEHRPVIGRHSRPSAPKWPTDATTLQQVYPSDGSARVRVLGGADPVVDVLGHLPDSWEVLQFGDADPRPFLAGLDFFVYYHDPRWVEAFGRTILEALASGAVAVLPPHFQALFGDGAVYAEPHQVAQVVQRLRADREEYDAQSARGNRFARENFGHEVHVARVSTLIGAPTAAGTEATAPEAEPPAPRPVDPWRSNVGTPARPGRPDGGPRILLMSSNGAGMGHLTRLFSYATRLSRDASPAILSLSQAAPLARQLDLPFEYLPSARALALSPGRWRPIFVSRVVQTLQRFDPDLVVFDGTWPYHGIEEIRRAHPRSRWVWSRRGMWREGKNAEQIAKSSWFDEILEPGDLAAPADRGATVDQPAHRVHPVTLVDPETTDDRATARAALGLPADGPLALVSLGAGTINDTTSDLGAAVAALTRLGVGCCVTVPEIAGAGRAAGENLHLVRDYPLSRRYAAFDVVVSASGYNSFHELLRLGVPSLFVPNTSTSLDDQLARARYAADQGWAHQVPHLSVRSATPLLEDLLARGSQLAASAQAADPGNGAPEAAAFLTRVAKEAQR